MELWKKFNIKMAIAIIVVIWNDTIKMLIVRCYSVCCNPSVLGSLRQETSKLETSLGNLVRPYLKIKVWM